MLNKCRMLIQQDQSLIDIWLVVANLYAASGDKDATVQVWVRVNYVILYRELQTLPLII